MKLKEMDCIAMTLKAGEEGTEELKSELIQLVRKMIGPVAKPDLIHFTPGLPKTRSGKIMRRILRKVAENDYGNLGYINISRPYGCSKFN